MERIWSGFGADLERIPNLVQAWLLEKGYGHVAEAHPVAGGCINHGLRLQTTQGPSFFLKVNTDAPADMFSREVEGLQALNLSGTPRVPQPFLSAKDFLLLEDLAPAPRRATYWQEFGYQLAALHQHTSPQFGFLHDNYIGSTPQPNPWNADGYTFFTEQRLLYQAHLGRRLGWLNREIVERVERLAGRLRSLVPEQPASLIHGDLWSGNALSDARGAPAIIDPAAHYGWAEAELAMSTLFGAFPDVFYRAYQEVRPLERDFRQRFALYNLYHLLNHVNLFGSTYLGQVIAVLRQY